jgi:hypothetical protein
MSHKDFDALYVSEMQKTPKAKRYNVYIRTECEYVLKHGKRRYSNWASFRAAASRRRVGCQKQNRPGISQ